MRIVLTRTSRCAALVASAVWLLAFPATFGQAQDQAQTQSGAGENGAKQGADSHGTVTRGEDGKYYTEDGTPTYHVAEDGTVDWYTYSGFRRYHGDCHVCHGPDGLGSTYAPALADSLKRLSYTDFMEIVVNGKQEGQFVMPSFGENQNVMCYLDDLYIYLKARADGAIGRGRPTKREDKPDAAKEAEAACFGS